MRRDFRDLRLVGLGRGNFFQFDHAIQNGIALNRGTFGIFQRRKSVRTANQAREQRSFGQIQLRRALAEISLRSCFNAVTAGAEIDAVDVELENLVFGEIALDAQSDHCFQQFAADGAASEWETVAGELLGDATGAFLGRAAQDIVNKRTQNSAPVNSTVLIKTRILPGQHGIDKKGRDLIERNLQPVRAGETAINFSIDIEDGVALGHFAHLLHIKGSGPGSEEKENAQTAGHEQAEKRKLPAETKKFAAPLPSRLSASEQFHR